MIFFFMFINQKFLSSSLRLPSFFHLHFHAVLSTPYPTPSRPGASLCQTPLSPCAHPRRVCVSHPYCTSSLFLFQLLQSLLFVGQHVHPCGGHFACPALTTIYFSHLLPSYFFSIWNVPLCVEQIVWAHPLSEMHDDCRDYRSWGESHYRDTSFYSA